VQILPFKALQLQHAPPALSLQDSICSTQRMRIYGFRMIFGIYSHYSPNFINRLVFVMETQCIFLEVGTDLYNIAMCRVVRAMKMTGSTSDDWIY
jgi:hypothetical protein